MTRSREEARILAVAYASLPEAGSESGAGWVWSRLLGTFGETWVLTRTPRPALRERRDAILRELPSGERLHFVDVDLPRWTRIWRRDRPGTRLQRVEYLIWQFMALRRARQLQREVGFDLAWHLTWANIWVGSVAAFIGVPFVLGPVGGAVTPPWRMLGDFGTRGAFFEVVRAIGQKLVRYANPLARLAWERAELILVQNPETRDWLPEETRSKVVVLSNAVLEGMPEQPRLPPQDRPTAMFAGRLLPLKGAWLAIRAMVELPEWHLLICGDGPDGSRLRALARECGVASRVTFVGWQPRAEVFRLMLEEADVFLFPSLHDEGSWVVAEAVACGLPVVCLDRGGPPVLGGTPVHATTRRATVHALAEATRAALGSRPTPTVDTRFAARQETLGELVDRFGLLPSAGG